MTNIAESPRIKSRFNNGDAQVGMEKVTRV
jgi:hypothetical protein